MHKPSSQQADAIEKIESWIDSPRGEIALAGLAGTGKTWTLSYLFEKIRAKGALVMAPTNKAAVVLRSKGVFARTIHSVLYNYSGSVVDDDGNETPVFADKDHGEVVSANRSGIFVVDEASMVNQKQYDDIMAIAKGVLWVGDHFQLPPIGGDPEVLSCPGAMFLEEIHRQAADNPIIRFAHALRNGSQVDRSFSDGDRLKIGGIAQDDRLIDYAEDHAIEQVIVAVNGSSVNHPGSRHRLNHLFRKQRGMKEVIEPGDRLIATFNNYRAGVFNGQLMKVTEVDSSTLGNAGVGVTVKMDDSGEEKSLVIEKDALGNPAYRSSNRLQWATQVDYGYAITGHKSQGSQWNRVLVVDSMPPGFDAPRWRYTASTRAAEHLSVVLR